MKVTTGDRTGKITHTARAIYDSLHVSAINMIDEDAFVAGNAWYPTTMFDDQKHPGKWSV